MTLKKNGMVKHNTLPKKIKCKGCNDWVKITEENQMTINNVCVIDCSCGCENEIILY